ncbi:restriction endonuclease subunit S [Shewanella sp. SG41-3]|uniref:restriction endonuclease subunit S n=1 Tax=Shewanella sp. SG41-3 TaxID=2760977 RepID=UPI0015FF24E6|nr:restriction endonuclease subunit S [Shewanella sp. SG41-3]MBB1475844.1 restriction endonuclease subunit S [Shewanella sp. SG41-3]
MSQVIPEGWAEQTLGNTVIVERGSSPRPIKNFQTDNSDGVNWIKIGDTKEGQKYVTSTKEKITPEGALKSRFVDVGDFILSNSMSFGRPYIMKISGYIHDGWFALRLPSLMNTDYFYYLLSSSYVKNQFDLLAVGGVVKNISGDLVKKAILPLPSLAEQKVIAGKLDELLAQVESTKARLDAIPAILKSFRQSVLAAAVSGRLTDSKYLELSGLKNYVSFKQGTQVSSPEQVDEQREGYEKFLRIINFTQKSNDFKYVPKSNSNRYINEDDIVMVRYGATSGFVGKGLSGVLANNLFMISPDGLNLTKDYLYIFLTSPIFQNYLKQMVKGGAMPAISFKLFDDAEIELPPFKEQAEIVRRVEDLFTLADKIEAQVNAAQLRVNNLTQSMLAKAFRGELTADWRTANPELISGENSAEALLERIKAEREALATKKKPTKKASIRKKA